MSLLCRGLSIRSEVRSSSRVTDVRVFLTRCACTRDGWNIILTLKFVDGMGFDSFHEVNYDMIGEATDDVIFVSRVRCAFRLV